ncbi:reverse transcriptase domain-containing protein [Tanacetum coccineum]|uniref:Reverse transcriptase domain-containing protein n=1 Tax=Tanacetum coccineum TaxID=301880 RepID=A0ABQ5ALY2_9ASTR
MFNSTLTGSARVWFDDLPPKSIDNYDDLKKAFLANYLQQKKCINDPVEIHHIKQRGGESTKDFVQRFKAKSWHVKGASDRMRISGFMHGITNPELIKRLHDNIPKNQQRSEQRRDKFTLLTKSPKELLAPSKGKFKAPPPMKTLMEKRNNNKFCEFHGEVRHSTDECMHLKRQIEELINNGKLSHVIKKLKQGSGKDQPKAAKKGETFGKDKPLEILMVQPWKRVSMQKIMQSFSPSPEILFPPLGDEDRAKGPMIIEAKIRGHFIHLIYVDGGSASEILYEHSFNRLRPKAMSEEDSSSPVNSSRNAKILGPRRDTHAPKKQNNPLKCTMVSGLKAQPFDIIQAAEERIKVAIHLEYPEQTIAIGFTLVEEGHKALCDLLRRSLAVFAWKPADMTGVPRHIAEHRLNVREGCSLVRQKKRSQAPEKDKATQEEVEKLVDADIMKEVHYHSWLSNPVMVKKHDDRWRMCVDFKDLNKACPKDGYPLPEID